MKSYEVFLASFAVVNGGMVRIHAADGFEIGPDGVSFYVEKEGELETIAFFPAGQYQGFRMVA